MSNDSCALCWEVIEQRQGIPGDGFIIVPIFGLIREAVASLVQSNHSVSLGEDRRNQVPNMRRGSEAMQKQDGAPFTTPIPVVKGEAIQAHQLVSDGGHHL